MQLRKYFLILGVVALFNPSLSMSQNLNEGDFVDPCPMPDVAASETPDDLAKVQADIDRFTLCVERAQLLRQLNDLAMENDDSLFGPSLSNPGLNLETKEDTGNSVKKMAEQLQNEIKQNFFVPEEAIEETPVSESEPINEWVILNINGVDKNLTAKLRGKDQVLATVKQGDLLPDGKKVHEVSPTSVILRHDNDNINLTWLSE